MTSEDSNSNPKLVGDNSNKTESDVVFMSEPSFENIPVEIFLEICSYLEPGFISHTLSIVCKRFESILADDSLWKYWVQKRLQNNKYPPVPCTSGSEHFRWDEECAHIDRLQALWRDEKTTTKHVTLENAHYASVDAILLLNDGGLCVSGGRDRSLAVWNVREAAQSGGGANPRLKVAAHEGWVWALAATSPRSNTLLSASWDSYVKAWDLESLTETHSFKCSMSVLCIVCVSEHVAMAGLYSPDIVVLDSRAGSVPVAKHRVHKASVLGIAHPTPGGDMLYTASEDRTLAAFDMRKGLLRRRKHLTLAAPNQPYALSLAANNEVCPHALYAGDSHGGLHLYDLRTLQKLAVTELWENARSSKVNGLALSPAALFACSEAGNISIMNPSFPPNKVSEITLTSKISGLDYENDVLAVGTCDSTVELWVPLDSQLFE